jgi:hypothetical protein
LELLAFAASNRIGTSEKLELQLLSEHLLEGFLILDLVGMVRGGCGFRRLA